MPKTIIVTDVNLQNQYQISRTEDGRVYASIGYDYVMTGDNRARSSTAVVELLGQSKTQAQALFQSIKSLVLTQEGL